ncbi:hypothetical protein SLS58_001189 [Diplodia intermedia]|uniref:Zn(2)-C6 fungal-type domain-containing protein n=1 Tax=Diplodia intermedia TaxID=856260 RepID=A0ABR3U368_9PEZI
MAEPESSAESRKRRRGQRSNRPCDPCRRRKTRCIVESGSSGECTVCLYRQTKCTYEESPPERPLPRRPSSTAASTSTVDAATRHPPSSEVAHLSPGSGDIPRSAPSLPQLPSVRTNEELPSDVLSSGEASAAALEAARERQRNGETVSEAERAKGEKSLGLHSTRFAELYGLGSDMEPILMRHRPYDPVHHEFRLSTHAIRRVLERDQGVSDEKAAGYSATHQEVDAIEACVKPFGERLVRLFWRVVQPSYPILHQKGFVDQYSRSYRFVPSALLGACKPEDPLNPDHTFGWGLASQALAIGEACGLHLDASGWAIPDWERALRKRLSWALYMQDKWTACAYGRPSHITDDEWGVRDLDSADFGDCEADSDDPAGAAIQAGQEQFLHMRDHWRETLNSYIWTLRTMSKSNEPIRYAVNRLEGAILRGLEHALVIAVDGPSTEMAETPQQTFEAGVNGFGFGISEINDWEYQGQMHLGAFDYLSNNAPAAQMQ